MDRKVLLYSTTEMIANHYIIKGDKGDTGDRGPRGSTGLYGNVLVALAIAE